MKSISRCILLTSVLFVGPLVTFGQKEVLFSFCKFTLTNSQVQSNLSFTQMYTYKLSKDGKPVNLHRLGKDIYVSDESAAACFANWKFSGFSEGDRIVVFFRWEHGIGWTRMGISSKDFSQSVINGDGTCAKGLRRRTDDNG